MLKKRKEKLNAEQIAKIMPYMIYHNMFYNFVRNPNKKLAERLQVRGDIFTKTLFSQRFTTTAFDGEKYKWKLPKGQIMTHGIIYQALYNVYMKYISKGFDSDLLYADQAKYNKDKIIIDSVEYKRIPKRYRGVFSKYGKNHYIWNTPYDNMKIIYSKQNKQNIEKLLERARVLIPLIYREPTPDIDFGGFQIFENITNVPDTPDSYKVSDKQLNAVNELHDIFVELSKITLPVAFTPCRPAYSLMYDYLKEKHQENIVYHASQTYKEFASQTIGDIESKLVRSKDTINQKEIKTVLKTKKPLLTQYQKCKQLHETIMDDLRKILKPSR